MRSVSFAFHKPTICDSLCCEYLVNPLIQLVYQWHKKETGSEGNSCRGTCRSAPQSHDSSELLQPMATAAEIFIQFPPLVCIGVFFFLKLWWVVELISRSSYWSVAIPPKGWSVWNSLQEWNGTKQSISHCLRVVSWRHIRPQCI